MRCRSRLAWALAAGAAGIGVLWAQAPSRSVWDGVYSEAQAARGQDAYRTMCLSCHGAELGGGEAAPPLAGGDFLSNWNGLTVGDLFERIRISMPADRPGKITRDQNVDVLAYIFRVNEFPAGRSEMERQTESLKTIRILSIRPEK